MQDSGDSSPFAFEQADPLLHPPGVQERERAYSPSSCIGGDYRPFIQAYVERSLAAREAALALGGRWIEGCYGHLPGQRIDLCLPPRASSGSPCPLLIFIHGGYWQELSARASLFAATRCIEQGLAFAAVDYTLAPHASLGQIVDECRAAWCWLMTEGVALGIDGERAVVAGSSAGAHLAAMVALQPSTAGSPVPRPCAAVLVSGIYDLQPLVGTSINHALGLSRDEAWRQSPVSRPLIGFPPTLVVWGEVETQAFKAQSRGFAAALRSAGAATTLLELPQRNHFDVILDLTEPGTVLGDATFAMLQGVALAQPGQAL